MKDDRSGRVAGVVLAAGTSSRMGRNKLFLRLGGTSVLRRAVATAREAGLDPVLVVLGHESGRALAELEGLSCTPVLNQEYASGMNTSVRAGISAVPADATGAVLMLADMPFVTAGMLRSLVDRYRDGDGCGKRVVKAHRAEAIEVEWPPSALTDLDVPDDLERVRTRIEGG